MSVSCLHPVSVRHCVSLRQSEGEVRGAVFVSCRVFPLATSKTQFRPEAWELSSSERLFSFLPGGLLQVFLPAFWFSLKALAAQQTPLAGAEAGSVAAVLCKQPWLYTVLKGAVRFAKILFVTGFLRAPAACWYWMLTERVWHQPPCFCILFSCSELLLQELVPVFRPFPIYLDPCVFRKHG